MANEKDAETLVYMSNPVIFADIFNFVLHDGEQIISAENLTEQDRTESLRREKDDAGKVMTHQRDVTKLLTMMDDGAVTYAVLGIENQAELDASIPWRVLRYDVERYDKQARDIVKRNKDNNKFTLSGFTAEDKFHPVVTIVVYWGTDTWTLPRTFPAMMDTQDEKILRYVPRFEIPIIEPRKLTDAELNKFSSELKTVFRFIRESSDKKRLKKLCAEDEALKNMSSDAAYLLSAVTNVKITLPENRKEQYDMTKGFEDWSKEERAIGRKEGRMETAISNIRSLMQTLNLTAEKAMDALQIPTNDREKYLALI